MSRVRFDWLIFVLYPRFSKSNVEHCVYWTFMFDIFYLEQSEVGRLFTSFFIGYILLFFFNVIITKRRTYIIWNIYYKRNYLIWKRHLNYYTILRNNKKNSDDKESYLNKTSLHRLWNEPFKNFERYFFPFLFLYSKVFLNDPDCLSNWF